MTFPGGENGISHKNQIRTVRGLVPEVLVQNNTRQVDPNGPGGPVYFYPCIKSFTRGENWWYWTDKNNNLFRMSKYFSRFNSQEQRSDVLLVRVKVLIYFRKTSEKNSEK